MKYLQVSILALLCGSLLDEVIGCLTTLNELTQLEKEVTNFSLRRTYTLCPNTRFTVGRYDYSYNLVEGQDPLVVRPNLHVKCGQDGHRSNQCLLETGDILVRDIATDDPIQGAVVLQGLTLVDPGIHFVKFKQPNDVQFVDCEFRQATRAKVPFLLDYYNPPNPFINPPQRDQLRVSWYSCDFRNNNFNGTLAQPSMIVATNLQVSLGVHGSRFTNNDFVTHNVISERNSFLIDAGGPLELSYNCFSWNAVGVSPVVSYFANNHGVSVSQNYAEVSRGTLCPFVSHFRTSSEYETRTPFCLDFDASSCQADSAPSYWTPTPSSMPTSTPAVSSSGSPVVVADSKTLGPNQDASPHESQTPSSTPVLIEQSGDRRSAHVPVSQIVCLVAVTWLVLQL